MNKLIEKLPDPCNSKEHYLSIGYNKENKKSVKQLKIITYQPKTFENLNTFYIKSVITEHPKSSHITIRQNEKVGSNSSLYGDTKKI